MRVMLPHVKKGAIMAKLLVAKKNESEISVEIKDGRLLFDIKLDKEGWPSKTKQAAMALGQVKGGQVHATSSGFILLPNGMRASINVIE